MINITFTPGAHDGEAKDNPARFPAGLVYLAVQAEASDGEYSGFASGWVRPEVAKLVKAAPELFTMLNELDGLFDEQTYQEQSRLDNDAPDDHEFCVNLTAKQLRAINALLLKAGGAA